MFLKTDGAGNLSFSSDLPTTSFTGATVETSIADSDLVLIYDDSATAVRKMTKANFTTGLGGKVLQVVNGSYASQASTTSTTFQDLSSDTNVSITCSSASNKVLIIAHFNECYLNGSHCLWIRITAGGSEIIKSECVLYGPSGERLHNQNITFLYSPNSTSSIQYKMQFKSNNGSNVRINQNSSVGGSSLTLMEIAG